ncbi:MAG: geranylgeranylglyceryl/heptaprenylglyceryl phosphate synthase [Bacteroidetes bacterium]|nr:MAG: geranylgeranylglyceryl/heptaprenylglyceryl phosphate synthase [Bacteroidota bacterium]
MMNTLYSQIDLHRKEGKKSLAVLVDPDKTSPSQCTLLAQEAGICGVDFFFVGSSILRQNHLQTCVEALKKTSSIPVILFPGNIMQVSSDADAILFLSLISGRNPELLIGNHVLVAPMIRASKLEVIPTGYMLIDSGAPTSASYMSQTFPIPHDKNDIAECTAIAGELLGLKAIYLDAGSGARFPIRADMVSAVRKAIKIPLIVGGGIKTAEKAIELCAAGTDIIVVGNAIESQPNLLNEIAGALKESSH